MNKEESLALYEQGRDAWNAWAEEMLAQRKALEAAGEWGTNDEPTDAQKKWREAAEADFSDHAFGSKTNFSQFRFPGAANFSDVVFRDSAWFMQATFEDAADFFGATFESTVQFDSAKFRSRAAFLLASFAGLTRFSGVRFEGDAIFLQAVFKGFTCLDGATFERAAEFTAIDVEKVFDLSGAVFSELPGFIQACFKEAPNFDNVIVKPQRVWTGEKHLFKGAPGDSARWRALKRLAIQGHDHRRELEFFKEEMKARRGLHDKPWHGVFWFGLFYGWFSDFGRSFVRPFVWWWVSTLTFACLYLGRLPALAETPLAGFSWAGRWFLQWLGGSPPYGITCTAGAEKPAWSAFLLSVRKGLLVFGQGSSSSLERLQACLYGIYGDTPAPAELPARFVPKIPNEVMVIGLLQNLISAVLIFLFLLAVRNHFRIK